MTNAMWRVKTKSSVNTSTYVLYGVSQMNVKYMEYIHLAWSQTHMPWTNFRRYSVTAFLLCATRKAFYQFQYF